MNVITPSRIALGLFTLAYIVIAAFYFISVGNTEFLGYIAAVALILALVACTLKWTCLPDWLLWMLSLQMLLHILGGGIQVANDVLYNYVVMPLDNPTGLTFIKFDQIVHTYGSIIAALAVYFFLARDGKFHPIGLALLTIFGAMGIGAMNEIIEFVAKLTIPDTDVGGYYNTAIDLVVNLIGSIIGTLIGLFFWKKHS